MRPNRASSEPSDETQMLAGLRQGDSALSEQFVRRYGGRMLAVARRLMQNEEDAQECVQEAFLQAFRHLHTFEERASLSTWLHRIVVNVALNKLRTRSRRSEEPLDDWQAQFDQNGVRLAPISEDLLPVETLLSKQETRNRVRQAIDALPETHRLVLILRDIEGQTTEETAQQLELTPSNVKTRFHRARAALKKRLEPLLRGEVE